MKKSYRSILSIGLLAVLTVSLAFMLTGCGLFNRAPTAKITTDPQAQDGTVPANIGQTVEFDGSDSSDPDGSIASYEWTFSDEFNSNSPEGNEVQTGSYDSSGTYTVTLKVTDDAGKSDQDSLDVEVS